MSFTVPGRVLSCVLAYVSECVGRDRTEKGDVIKSPHCMQMRKIVFFASPVRPLRSLYRRPNNPLEIWDYGTAELQETIPWNRSSAQVKQVCISCRRAYPGIRKEGGERQQTILVTEAALYTAAQ